MRRRLITLLAPILILVAAMVGGWLLTNALRDTVQLGSGFDACFNRRGSSVQIECLSDRLEVGARQAAAGLSGPERDDRLLAYVRTAEANAADDPRFAGACHPAMHRLGRSEGHRAAVHDTVPAFPTGSSQLCTAGYVHGLAEGYLTGTPDAQVAAVFPALCHVTKARAGCAHGVGHALLRARADEPARSAAEAATQRCGGLPGEFPASCMNGVYMELAMRTLPRPVTPMEFTNSCTTEDVESSLSCWGYLTINLATNDLPLSEAPKWCARADLPGQFPCIEQYGRALGVDGVSECGTVSNPPALKQRCVDGAIGLQVGSGHVTDDAATDACDDLSTASLRSYCTRAVGRYAKGRAQVEGS
ncbi:MAG: hypothetical protein JWL76_987 [Thermoleophilia bacterium]|nr:hypothetical protein [Thermoleophilia bacterium]